MPFDTAETRNLSIHTLTTQTEPHMVGLISTRTSPYEIAQHTLLTLL